MYTSTQLSFLRAAHNEFPGQDQLTRDEIRFICTKHNVNTPQWLTTPVYNIARGIFKLPSLPELNTVAPTPEESDSDLNTRIKETFESMEELISCVASNTVNSLVIAGGAGLGKSYTVNNALSNLNSSYVFHRGYLKASHLFRLLWENRNPGQVIVLDDCDLWKDETALNILKAALELKPKRSIGWGSEKEFEDQDGETIPRYFMYEGSVIFLTNLNVRDMIASNDKNAPHLQAIESRSLLLDLKIKTKREYLVKIRQTLDQGMLRNKGISKSEEDEIMDFIESNIDKLTDVSLRMVEKVASLFRAKPDSWQKVCRNICFR